MKRPHLCPVCGQFMFSDSNHFEICPVCDCQADIVPEDGGYWNRLRLNLFKAQWQQKQKEQNPVFEQDEEEGSIKCPICGQFEFVGPGTYDICEVCGWENDGVQYDDHDYDGGANWLSINRARENYQKYGQIMTEQDKKESSDYYFRHVMPDGRWLYNTDFEPFTTIGATPDAWCDWLNANNTEIGLATALAQTHNEIAFQKGKIIGLDGPELAEAEAIYDNWVALLIELSEQVYQLIKTGKSPGETKLVEDGYNLHDYRVVEPFMNKYGYYNGDGLWVKQSEQ